MKLAGKFVSQLGKDGNIKELQGYVASSPKGKITDLVIHAIPVAKEQARLQKLSWEMRVADKLFTQDAFKKIKSHKWYYDSYKDTLLFYTKKPFATWRDDLNIVNVLAYCSSEVSKSREKRSFRNVRSWGEHAGAPLWAKMVPHIKKKIIKPATFFSYGSSEGSGAPSGHRRFDERSDFVTKEAIRVPGMKWKKKCPTDKRYFYIQFDDKPNKWDYHTFVR